MRCRPRIHRWLSKAIAASRCALTSCPRPRVRPVDVPGRADPELVERVAVDMSSAPPEVAVEAVYNALSYDRVMPGLLEELDLPLVAINPDGLGTDVESLERYGAEVLLLPEVGHFLMMEDPEGVDPTEDAP